MHFFRKVLQLKRFLGCQINLTIEFFIYKHFERNNIVRNEEDISGKCVVLTGGSSGIGRSSAREFALRGATVVIGDVDLENGETIVREIQEQTGNMNVTIFKLDLSDMDSVEQFARKVSKQHPKIKILLNNAGIGGSKDENIKTKDGFNIHIAVNYMGHFLLTNLLLENLKAETNPRIVSTTSMLMLMSELDIDDLNMDRSGFGLMNALPYCNTKYCLALFTRELGMRCRVNAYAVDPGAVNTPIMNAADTPSYLKLLFRMQRSSIAYTADEAASEYIMYCALETSIKDETGHVYRFRKPFRKANKKLDNELASRLWDKSSDLLRLNERITRITK